MEFTVQHIQSGNINSFEQVYHQYHTRLYYYVLKYTRSAYLAEEAVQLTFIKLWENRRQLSPNFDLSVQLFRIARSTTIDLLRKEGPAGQPVALLSAETAALTVETDIEHKDQLSQVEALIEELSPVRKKIFKLSRFEELSHKEIAEQLSISPKTVENHIGRAISQLKNKMVLLFLLLTQLF
ncbi:MAG: RNA polymerase sigma-70 factor [Candidatus Pseudobacter hemicellulosilyticus]|uniref:RNA polymerase sigma-70 factor n=1 Tax=Candidatus Pseudobacter hemicellulosilyticus TaxID=3121375 RepID=A0AAJ6BGP4_9BACT|nr:MAG: RNA polymerase sigma-70 factor [Pseudobacter sp.]